MIRKINALLLFFLTLYFCIFSHAKSSVWIAEKNGNRIFIAGSAHLLHPSQLPLPIEYTQALNASEQVVFETNLDQINSPEFQFKTLQRFMLPPNKTLRDTLNPEVWNKLQDYMLANNIPQQLTSFNSAFLTIALPIYIYQQQGYQNGIDSILTTLAKQQHKTLGELETAEDQLNILASLNNQDPNQLIENMLIELSNPEYALAQIIQDVLTGDNQVLNKLITQMEQQENSYAMYESLILKRNKAWMNKIENYAHSGTPTFIIVGALHLVGEQGVLNLLRQQGYKISYYEATP